MQIWFVLSKLRLLSCSEMPNHTSLKSFWIIVWGLATSQTRHDGFCCSRRTREAFCVTVPLPLIVQQSQTHKTRSDLDFFLRVECKEDRDVTRDANPLICPCLLSLPVSWFHPFSLLCLLPETQGTVGDVSTGLEAVLVCLDSSDKVHYGFLNVLRQILPVVDDFL